MMVAKLVSLSLIVSGAGAFGAVAYMQHHPPSAETPTQTAAPAPRRVFPDKPVEVDPDEDAPEVALPAMVVKRKSNPKPATKVPPRVPCSGWRDLGYEHVDNGTASDVRRVRELCPSESSQ